MKTKVIFLLLTIFICSTLVYSQTNNQLTQEQKIWLSKANRHGFISILKVHPKHAGSSMDTCWRLK